MNSRRSHFLLLLALCGAILAVSTASLFIRYLQQERVPSVVIAAWRLTLATLLLTPATFGLRRAGLSRLGGKTMQSCLLAGVFLALHFAAWITSLEYTSVASSVVLVTTTPLWVALCAPFVLGERAGSAALAGMFLALIGGTLLTLGGTCQGEGATFRLLCTTAASSERSAVLTGDALALVGAWMAAGYVLIGRKVRAQIALLPYLFLVYGTAAVLLTGGMLLARQSPFGYPSDVYLWLSLLAIVPQGIGHSTLNWALRYLPASFVSVALLGEPIGSTLLAALFLAERPQPAEIIGGIIILAGLYLAGRGAQPLAPDTENRTIGNQAGC